MRASSNTIDRSDPPYLSVEPPPLAARALAWVLIGAIVAAAIAAVVVRVPETVQGRFVLVPVSGTDPVRALRRGQVTDVRVSEGESVAAGAPLVVVRSDPVGDLSSELGTLEAQLRGADDAVRNARVSYEARRSADEQNRAMLAAQLATLTRSVTLKQRQQQLAADLAANYKQGLSHGSISGDEYTAREMDATRLADEQSSTEGQRTETVAAIAKLRHEMDSRDADYRESVRKLAEDRERARIRVATLQQELAQTTGNEQVIVAPCRGTVLGLRVRGAGAVVQDGEFVAEVACADQRMQAELQLPPSGVDRVRPGQPVKLLYDAFPYQRFGVRRGRVRWVSPAASLLGSGAAAPATAAPDESNAAFRAVVDVDEAAIPVEGHRRPLLAGMGGEARVVVARRSLVSYAFEPLRELRESLAGGQE